MSELKYVGNAQSQAVDGLDKVMGRARYVGDLQIPGMLYAKILRSPLPHARLVALDVGPALEVPGVLAAITAEDFVDHGAFGWPVKDAFVLAHEKVRFAGDPIAVVAAETEAAARAGVEAIELRLEPLPVVSDPRHALDPEAPPVPLEAPAGEANVCARHLVRNGDPEPILEEAPVLLDQTYTFLHQEHAYLEPHGALAIPQPDGSVTIFANDQSPFVNRANVAMVLDLPEEKVRIIQPPVGGSFGGKDDGNYQYASHVARLALMTGRPVRLTLTTEEDMTASYKREAMDVRLRIGATEDGRLRAVKAEMLADSGAYASMTPLSAWRATMHAGGTYRYEAAQVDTVAVYTNNGYCGAFRGFGNPQATAASEMAVDELAHRLQIDPIDFRLRNGLRRGDRAFTGNVIDHEVGLQRCLEWVRERSDWDRKRARPATSDEVRRGIGVACYFHGSGLGGEGLDYANITLEIERDHSITLQSGLTDYGQGSRTVFTLLAAEALGVAPERIEMLRPDTDTAIESGPTVASRASMVGGNATLVAGRKLDQLLRLAAADALQCEPEQLVRAGEQYIGPSEEPLTFEEVVDHAFELGLQLSTQGYWQIPEIHWDFEKGTGTPYFCYTFGAQVVEVEVDTRTGEVKATGIWAAHDAGKIIFPKGAQGQMLGGIAQGLGYGLTEGFDYEEGYPQQHNFDRYHIPSATDLPEMEVTYIETTLPEGPFGAKNLAEPVMLATAPALANAVFHATGVRVRDLPLRPEKILQGLKEQGE
ncbi:MAG: xanthine dehydrogenase family protein molybdopterin-binding subunit [Anaerolineales bacterium]